MRISWLAWDVVLHVYNLTKDHTSTTPTIRIVYGIRENRWSGLELGSEGLPLLLSNP